MRPFHHPTAGDLKLENVLYALGDSTRLKIVAALNRSSELPCSAAVCGLELPKSTQHHHFRVLREAGVIFTRKSGVYIMNSLRRDELDAQFPGLLDAVLAAANAAERD